MLGHSNYSLTIFGGVISFRCARDEECFWNLTILLNLCWGVNSFLCNNKGLFYVPLLSASSHSLDCWRGIYPHIQDNADRYKPRIERGQLATRRCKHNPGNANNFLCTSRKRAWGCGRAGKIFHTVLGLRNCAWEILLNLVTEYHIHFMLTQPLTWSKIWKYRNIKKNIWNVEEIFAVFHRLLE